MPVQKLSKSSEQRLSSALSLGQDLIESGSSVNEALAKAASEKNIPLGQIHLLAKAYNIGCSEALRKSGATLDEKTQDFETADTDAIMSLVCPASTKTAAGVIYSEEVDPDYDYPPFFEATESEKQAQLVELSRRLDFYGIDKVDLTPKVDQSRLRIHEMEKLAKIERETRYDIERTTYEIEKARDKIARTLAVDPHIDIYETVSEVESMWGKQARSLLEDIVDKSSSLRKKATANRIKSGRINQVDADLSPYKEVRRILDLQTNLDILNKRHAKTAEELVAIKNQSNRAIGAKTRKTSLGVLNLDDDDTEFDSKEASLSTMFGTALGTSFGRDLVGQSPLSKSKSDLESSLMGKIEDPVHEQELRSIKSEALLNNLMATDDIISGYDPGEVLQNYNELVQMAPHAADQQGIVRAILRRRLQQGGLDQFEVEQLLKIENYLKRRDNPSFGGGFGGQDGGMDG